MDVKTKFSQVRDAGVSKFKGFLDERKQKLTQFKEGLSDMDYLAGVMIVFMVTATGSMIALINHSHEEEQAALKEAISNHCVNQMTVLQQVLDKYSLDGNYLL